mmetsp:Transcript_11314/g.32339  ORF Transcript_11314/g.32339 Transcript_11314/m.32339 type:complete len:198 (+) Transcript_11314:93-686(+)
MFATKQLLLLGVAGVGCFATSVANTINTCGDQLGCLNFRMMAADDKCKLPNVLNKFGDVCSGRWKVCLSFINKEGCPHSIVSAACPGAVCTGEGADPFAFSHRCGPHPTHADICKYGMPGDTLEFHIQDGSEDCSGSLELQPNWPSVPGEVHCEAKYSCKAAQTKICPDGGCELSKNPCVHYFTIPEACGCSPAASA